MPLEAKAPLHFTNHPLVGLSIAPVIYVNGIADIRFVGVNSQCLFYADMLDGRASFRKAAVTLVGPSGGLVTNAQMLMNFIKEKLPAH